MFRTDLAIEVANAITNRGSKSLAGVELFKENCDITDTEVSWVKITNKEGSEAMGKPIGNYITLQSACLRENDIDSHEKIVKLLSKYLIKLKEIKDNDSVLVVGLGNEKITPDALGPKVVSKVLVTRHIADEIFQQLKRSFRSVCAIAPGVMGVTGIETLEVVKGLVERVKPSIVIAIDALAARRAERINATIQMSDVGVCPGAGVGNKRAELSKETLGVDVIAIGVPTVVDAATLANDTLDIFLEQMLERVEKNNEFYQMLNNLEGEEKYYMIKEVLEPYIDNMFVTPKEVDNVIDKLSNIIKCNKYCVSAAD